MKRLRLRIIRKKTHSDTSRTKMALIVDHGGYTVKIEHSTSQEPQLVQNCFCISKSDHRSTYIGNQFNSLIDKASLYINYPIQKGYIVKWEYQKEVWDYLFNSSEFEECTLEILFEDYNTPPNLTFHNHSSSVPNNFSDKAALVVDSGFSFTHIVPVFEGKIYTNGVVRIDVGGKLMTNYLKEIVSLRQMNILNEPYMANQIKEDVCRVSPSFLHELKSMSTSNGPKSTETQSQFLNITNEATVNFKERIFDDIRSDCPDFLTPVVELPENPITYAWEGGKYLSTTLEDDNFTSKSQYDELGSSRLGRMIFDLNYHHKNTTKLEIVT
ncbi:hypothetical protein MXB_4281 [Myxobolus squamalis]|nr:hypothetical protein MXB_4281 [Myxobolus squamalis]